MDIIIENGGLNGISNYEPLLAWAKERASTYKGLVVQEEAISVAKTDAAELRRLAKNASDYRIAIQKEHAAKIEKVTNQLKEITQIFSDAAEEIAVQVKSFEQKEKDEKKAKIEAYYKDKAGDIANILPFDSIFDPKWLNKSTSSTETAKTINATIDSFKSCISAIKGIGSKYEQEMISEYIATRDMAKALEKKAKLEAQEERIKQLQREEEERKARVEEQQSVAKEESESKAPVQTAQVTAPIIPEPVAEEKRTIDIRLYDTTKAQRVAFGEWLRANGIRYGSVPKE